MATVMVNLGSYIGVAALTRLGDRTNVVRNAEIVRDSGLGIEVFSSLTWEAATHSFSNVYHCAWNNGSAAGNWCCGAQEGTAEAEAGCCNTTLFDIDSTGGFGVFFGSAYESHVSATNNSASTATQGIPNSVPSNESHVSATNNSASTATQSIPNSVSSNQAACSLGANSTIGQNTPISKPQQQSREPVAIGVGVGIPLGMIAFGSLLLLFREHNLRLRAESTTGIVNGKRFNAGKSTGRALHEWRNHNAPQELGQEPKHPHELYSREVYEVAAY